MFDHDMINFTVEKVPVHQYKPFEDGSQREFEVPTEIGSLIRRTDDKEPMAIVKSGYEIVQYQDIVSNVESALIDSGMDLTDTEFTTNVYNKGRQLELRARFTAYEQYIDSFNRKDLVIPELVFRTSHDSTWANNGMMGLWRSMCWNTLVNGNKLAAVYGRHTKNFSLPAFTAKLKNAAEFISGDSISEMRKWYEIVVGRDNVVEFFSATLAKRLDNVSRNNKPNKVILSHLMKIFDEENRHLHGDSNYEKYGKRDYGSLWTVYNAATHWSSHTPHARSINLQNVKVQREDRVRKMLNSPEWSALVHNQWSE